MLPPTVERQLELAMKIAISGDVQQYPNAEARLRTLDRQGHVSAKQYAIMRLIADARAGRTDDFAEQLARIGGPQSKEAQGLKQLLLSAPEVRHASFREFVHTALPDLASASAARPISPRLVAALSAAAVVLLLIAGSAIWYLAPRSDDVHALPTATTTSTGALRVSSSNRRRSGPSVYEEMVALTGMVVLRAEVIRQDGTTFMFPAGTGSGFVVRSDGLILTNRHVIENGPKLVRTEPDVVGWDVVFVTGGADNPKVLDARIAHQSAYVDIALLRVEHDFGRALIFGPTPSPGDRVLAYGFPGAAEEVTDELNQRSFRQRMTEIGSALRRGDPFDLIAYIGTESLKPSVTSGIVSAIRQTEVGIMLQTDTFIHFGNSGGPVLDELGRVVGMATSGHREAQGINMCIAAKTIHEELARESGIKWPESFD